MTTIDTKHLRALAEAAHIDVAPEGSRDPKAWAAYLRTVGAFQKAIDPPTLIALLDEIERLRGDAGWEYYAAARKGYVAGEPRVHERGAIQAYEEELGQVVFEQEDETPVVFKRRVGPWEPVEGETND